MNGSAAHPSSRARAQIHGSTRGFTDVSHAFAAIQAWVGRKLPTNPAAAGDWPTQLTYFSRVSPVGGGEGGIDEQNGEVLLFQPALVGLARMLIGLTRFASSSDWEATGQSVGPAAPAFYNTKPEAFEPRPRGTKKKEVWCLAGGFLVGGYYKSAR